MGSKRARVYIDADTLMAAAGGDPLGAPRALLVSGNVTPLELICAETVVLESRRNVDEMLHEALPALDDLIEYGLRRVDDPPPSVEDRFCSLADDKDAIHLAAAVIYDCRYLVTYNVDDYEPGHPEVEVAKPGEVVRKLRSLIEPSLFEAEEW
ncbi:PIN domain-containing protein [Salinibacter sp.]|uniref:PIN domain-containing protein n=1 Tax=Salinibacter sp. TaxID=2065818 RepID=UPI0021E96970|nr:PIN domain-containing protein [Salinibacter sp.]